MRMSLKWGLFDFFCDRRFYSWLWNVNALLYFNWREGGTKYLEMWSLYCPCKNIWQLHITKYWVVNASVKCFQGWWKNGLFQSFFLALFTYNSATGRHNIFVIPWIWSLERVWLGPRTQYSFLLLVLTLPNDLTSYLMINWDSKIFWIFVPSVCIFQRKTTGSQSPSTSFNWEMLLHVILSKWG